MVFCRVPPTLAAMLSDDEKSAIRTHYQAIAHSLPGFRPRAPQRQMLAAIAQALSRSKPHPEGAAAPERQGESIVVIEGPTGVGKSLAYLIAGAIMAQMRGKTLVVTSATVALQEQLVHRDLPFVVQHSGLDISYALAKGRGRYLCPYKLYQLTQTHAQGHLLGFEAAAPWDTKPKKEELELLRALSDAFHERRFDGDRDTWPQSIDDAVWARITNDRHSCLKSACPNRSECPFFLARDRLENVDVVVANHDLLLSDIGMGGGVILPAPEASFYCIDEAHHLSKKAVKQFAAEHPLTQAQWFLEKLPTLVQRLAALTGKDELANLTDAAAIALLDAFSEWQWQCTDAPQLQAQGLPERETVWLWEDGVVPQELMQLVSNTALAARTLLKHLYQFNDALSAARRDHVQDAPLYDKAAGELGFAVARAEQMEAVWTLMENTPEGNAPPLAKWISCSREDKTEYSFHASPVSAAAQLSNRLWRKAAGAVLTSATLRSLASFDLLLRQTGLQWLPETATLALESPFDFPRQGELYLPPVAASPKDSARHTEEVAAWLPKLIDEAEPVGTLVLFSSRRQLNDVLARLSRSLQARVLAQGSLPKQALLQQHAEALAQGRSSIIFGLDSFAEGLDLPGEACVHVIIAKLPFAMPDNPVDKTLSRWISQNGGNPFIEITVPEASLKLVQAVGRLIRTESDYGRVTILDNRLTQSGYGRQMLAALPPFKRL